ncbi:MULTISPECIES: DivIVA domain-containing protein [Streptococcus]|uniref:Cell division protein DivIVA n=1 Tax=Streptococcus pantholopis TaxID=1811193 RepID=A0A172Q8E6_9STRE|nr:DivIVA domain-containing protein [Streptococcus pantholopis]AND79736.1 cell division protein DivIVA [Streptococcus pantholopis]
MALTALEIKDKTFNTRFRGYDDEEVDEFLSIVVDDYEELVRKNRDQENKIKELEEKLAYFDEMRESLSQSVILAQETAEKVKASASNEATNVVSKANYDAQHLIDEAKSKANEILRDATDEAKRVAVETEDLKRQSRVFHQRLIAAIEGQLGLANSPEWNDLLQPTAVYLQNSDAAFKEVVEKVLDEHVSDIDDTGVFDATRQFTPEEMEELQRRADAGNRQLAEAQAADQSAVIDTSSESDSPSGEINLSETQTFKLNIEE